jgi:hypothetical protein
MSSIRDLAQFTSDSLSPILPEECQVNPQVYGAELAFWLCTELAKHGIVTSYPSEEDWGWFIEYSLPNGSEFAIHCSNVDGKKNLWMLSLRRYAKKMFGRNKPSFEEADDLIKGIRLLLEKSSQVSDLKWMYETL